MATSRHACQLATISRPAGLFAEHPAVAGHDQDQEDEDDRRGPVGPDAVDLLEAADDQDADDGP
jgi:hypothetical protein